MSVENDKSTVVIVKPVMAVFRIRYLILTSVLISIGLAADCTESTIEGDKSPNNRCYRSRKFVIGTIIKTVKNVYDPTACQVLCQKTQHCTKFTFVLRSLWSSSDQIAQFTWDTLRPTDFVKIGDCHLISKFKKYAPSIFVS